MLDSVPVSLVGINSMLEAVLWLLCNTNLWKSKLKEKFFPLKGRSGRASTGVLLGMRWSDCYS